MVRPWKATHADDKLAKLKTSPTSRERNTPMPLTDHPTGGYRFLPGIAQYSCGVVSAPGFEIAHVTLHDPVTYRRGSWPSPSDVPCMPYPVH